MSCRILISACLIGIPCRYDGRAALSVPAGRLSNRCDLIPICPEQLGGLPTPRTPAECSEGRVLTAEGNDVTAPFERGAACALQIARYCGANAALLKARSPSCGSGQIYDGTFSGTLTGGNGITARLLRDNGIEVFDEEHIDDLLCWIDSNQR